MKITPLAGAACALAAVVALGGCSSSGSTTTGTGTASGTQATSAPASASVTLTDGWVKEAASGMTGVFGTLHNTTSAPITITGGSTPIAGKVETHEVVMVDGAAKMQPKAGGFTIPAGGTHVLAPGHDHIMLMMLTGPVKAGDTVTITLTLADGSSAAVTAIGKPFAAGNESYKPSGAASAAPSASMSGM